METTTELIPATTVTQLAGLYQQAEEKIRLAFRIIVEVEESMKVVFGDRSGSRGFDVSHLMSEYGGRGSRNQGRIDFHEPDRLMERMKLVAWAYLVDRMELRRFISISRAEQLTKQLETGEGLPEITEDGIRALMAGTLANVGTFREEAIKEVYEELRPYKHRENGGYQTNSAYEVERKVIKGWWIENGYSSERPFRVRYGADAKVRALDNVFHQLDGSGMVKTHYGPLYDAICAAGVDGRFETAYFKGRCFRNGNLHLEFKRLDLLKELNRIGGGNRLRGPSSDR